MDFASRRLSQESKDREGDRPPKVGMTRSLASSVSHSNPVVPQPPSALSLSPQTRYGKLGTSTTKYNLFIPVARNLQCAPAGTAITIRPALDYVYVIRSTSKGYTIKNGNKTMSWGLDDPVDTHAVNYGMPADKFSQCWIFQQV
ncbi:hypothetical protein EUX98_g6649 [Antrodiella citrinella]|uniref:CCL2-like lectin domain-containing protein n=1 Tax=Antrodiella citrinella TaxID=2447956 RepID=A0A4S4MVX9_9APHY|nr:hypothetical protein EUX98_g6649 [Antrodiella citrinella]